MMTPWNEFIAGIVCAFIIILIWTFIRRPREDFATVEEKANQLSKWFVTHPNGKYVEFVRDNPESNIVEFTKLRNLSFERGNISTKSAVEALRI